MPPTPCMLGLPSEKTGSLEIADRVPLESGFFFQVYSCPSYPTLNLSSLTSHFSSSLQHKAYFHLWAYTHALPIGG